MRRYAFPAHTSSSMCYSIEALALWRGVHFRSKYNIQALNHRP